MRSAKVLGVVLNGVRPYTEEVIPTNINEMDGAAELIEKVNNINPVSIEEVHNAVYDVLYPALPAPQNVEADGTTITFDNVLGAEKYIVYANGVEIGEVDA